MASSTTKATKTSGIKALQGSIAWRIGAANLAASIILTGTLGVLKVSYAPSFAIGFTIAVFNMLWLMRVLRKGMTLDSTKTAKKLIRGYFIRFAATVAVITLILFMQLANPLALMLGFTASIMVTICVMIFSALKEVSEDAP